ncbi:hypothetical protein EMIHUDRAFT_209529 [Emiliania huxleyi CCMP1516]|uniref:Uncharacterized protein n=2 Tax=Emiliania huxleyi TaxID=2903 RepID=A0A0D3J5V5_EMIH1|nr:hypothetical protein EMIHUDRAFT_209529 [Emiliania huxleyi CCMP1516]EOD18890.1 hypothetical protein EMIHUDRAFT_209529 [Emiliania huxleyi CCMP1516]|eukprot:XP_005771319.1 hypothetical protein EMIHUDRAFT_209529 [Emiliania huxleyi CCMP1516]
MSTTPEAQAATAAQPAPTPAAATNGKAEKEVKQMKWTYERDVALLTQVAAAGPLAWLTSKMGYSGDPERTYNQGAVWDKAGEGIIPQIKTHEAFAGVTTFPATTAFIVHTKRVVQSKANLYKSGGEQAEDAPAGSLGTKNEELSELDQLIIEVGTAMEEAERIGCANKEGKAQADADAMQDALAKRTYPKDGDTGKKGKKKKRAGLRLRRWKAGGHELRRHKANSG